MTEQTQLAFEPRELRAIRERAEQYRPDFAGWLVRNMPLWRRFCAEADRIWVRGRRHYSARTIIEYLRHHTALADPGDVAWKINGNYVPDLARLYLQLNPQREGLFELRAQSSAVRVSA